MPEWCLRCVTVRPTLSPPSVDAAYVQRLVEIAKRHGISHVGVCNAEVLQRARTELIRRKDAGLHDGLHVHRTRTRCGRPTRSRAVAGARSILVGARSYYADATRPRPPARTAASLAMPGPITTPLRDGLRAVARQLRRDGWRAVVFADDNSIVDREVAYRAGIGWFGKNANLLLPGAGSWFVLGCVVTTAPLPVGGAPCPTAAARAAGASTPARRGRSSRPA